MKVESSYTLITETERPVIAESRWPGPCASAHSSDCTAVVAKATRQRMHGMSPRVISSIYAVLLILITLPSTSSQTVCPAGFTQAPSTSTWGDKCYREIGPVTAQNTQPGTETTGYTHSQCDGVCKAASPSARVVCMTSAEEMTWVSSKASLKGWTNYIQDTTAPDYSEPAGGWGWQGCTSSYSPAWDNFYGTQVTASSSPGPSLPCLPSRSPSAADSLNLC